LFAFIYIFEASGLGKVLRVIFYVVCSGVFVGTAGPADEQ